MNLGPWEIALIIIVIVLLFGAKKLPDLARSVGRSMRIFKSEVQELTNDTAPQTQLPQAQQTPGFPVADQPNHGGQERPTSGSQGA